MKSYRQVLLSKVPKGQRTIGARALILAHGLRLPATLSALIRKLEAGTPTEPPPPEPPRIEVAFSGSIEHARFHVTGSKFLPDRPNDEHGVAIRVVDANILIETRREFTGSKDDGRLIDRDIEGDLTGLTVNALGVATVAISATDGRPNPKDITGFLWSNTVRKDFRA
jgi:hypothetical protein